MVYVELDSPGLAGDVDLVAGETANAADLAAALTAAAGDRARGNETVAIDDVVVVGPEPIRTRLRRGSRVTVRPTDQHDRLPAVVDLVGDSGWSSGSCTSLTPGRWYLSAAAGAEWYGAPPASGGFLSCSVAADGACTFAATRDPTFWVGDRATVGPATLSAGDAFRFAGSGWRIATPVPTVVAVPGGLPNADGRVPFHRPPRIRHPPVLATLNAPLPTQPYTAHARMSWAALAVPLVMGAAFAWLFGPLMALFALLTPVLVTGNWLEDRVRARRHGRRERARYADALQAFEVALDAAASTEQAVRRADRPPLTALFEHAQRVDPRVWERRSTHDDFMRVALGVGELEWSPPATLPVEPAEPALAVSRVLRDVPMSVDLGPGHMVGIVGERARRDAVARALVTRAAVLHGPADVAVACIAALERMPAWDWIKWLPHSELDGQSGRRLVAFERDDVDAVLTALLDQAYVGGHGTGTGDALTLLVVDRSEWTAPQSQLLRELYAGAGPPLSALVLADTVNALPARCTTVIDVRGRKNETPSLTSIAHAVVRNIATPGGQAGAGADLLPSTVRVAGTTVGAARRVALALAPLADPERREPGAGLPNSVSLLTAVALTEPTPDAVALRWRQRPARDDVLPIMIGARESGSLTVDLVRDGPHALIAGTTGSGKSELLRTLVSSLAVALDPTSVNFVLIDYKGGSAFDACARLPHVVGIVTDLDEHLGRRALVCLEAELRDRERRLRTAGAQDIGAYRAAGAPGGPLPRLVVVVDEFAALARELPDFMRSLVDVAQRGRSLGVHVVLATQRPAGVVNDQIRANTNLRIALRVQATADSTDVLDAPDAARLGRGRPGRGFARLGPGDLVPFQCAYVSGVSDRASSSAITLTRFVAAWAQPTAPVPDRPSASTAREALTDLERLAHAIAGAAKRLAVGPQRAPWPPPLPTSLTLEALATVTRTATDDHAIEAKTADPAVGLADEPEHQRQSVWRWRRAAGNLWCCGGPGSGASDALVTLAAAVAAHVPVDMLHLYAIDCGAGALEQLAALPHAGAVIRGSERERLQRLASLLEGQLEQRRTAGTGPDMLLVIDRYDELRSALDSAADTAVIERFAQIIRSGQPLGIHVALSTQRPGGVPASVAAALTQRLVFAMPDRQDYAAFGLRPADVPPLPPLRAVDASTGTVVQLARVAAISTAHTPRRWISRLGLDRRVGNASGQRPRAIGSLPASVSESAIRSAAIVSGDVWTLPVGIGNQRLEPVGFELHEGDHALVFGPPRSGKTTVLETLAAAARAAQPALTVTAVAPRRSRLATCPAVTRHLASAAPQAIAAAIREPRGPHLVLIDDADRIDDPAGELEGALREEHAATHVIAAARSDAMRGAYTHWTRRLRASRQALVLNPDPDADGELVGAALPRERAAAAPGRGYLLIGGAPELVQCAGGGAAQQ